MCGIVGIYLKNEKLKNSLGSLLSKKLINMGSRGPDSAGFAIYKKEEKEKFKYSICINKLNFKDFEERINKHLEAELKRERGRTGNTGLYNLIIYVVTGIFIIFLFDAFYSIVIL